MLRPLRWLLISVYHMIGEHFEMHTIALSTYGTLVQRGTSCMKCTNAVPTILLRLFGDHAKDLTPARASYRYIDVPGAHLTHNFLVLKLIDAEKTLVEELV